MRANAVALAADLRACNDYENGKAAARAVTCPTQVLLASDDRMAPRKAGMELAQHLSQPALTVIKNSGHMLPLEAPDETRQLLRDFIAANNPAA